MTVKKIHITPVILCGGTGSRLWPLSRKNLPKQFIDFDNTPLFLSTIKRFLSLENYKSIFIDEFLIVTSENYRFIVLNFIKSLNIKINVRIILEPVKKNTAPALTLASLISNEKNKNSILIVTPSDSYIQNNQEFKKSVFKACNDLGNNSIFVFGIKPTNPSQEFGYIKIKEDNISGEIDAFYEKPSPNKAKKFLKENNYFWNSGIFILRAETWIQAIQKSNYKIYKFIEKSIKPEIIDGIFIRPNKNFLSSPSDSIDYAVIEKFKDLKIQIKIVILKCVWNDLGGYKSLFDVSKKDKNNNSYNKKIYDLNSKNNYVHSSSRDICLYNVDNLIIIDEPDVLLICDLNKTKDINKFFNFIKTKKPELLSKSSKDYRPWGSFDEILHTANCKVKKIIVNPKSKISYQSHKFRSEHWIVVKGIATITLNDKKFIIKENNSFFISKEEKHRLENKENYDLIIIEVQFGSNLEESDIVRYDDDYGRIENKK